MRVLISAESFLPTVNGVTGSVVKIAENLTALGHTVRVIAPAPGCSEVAFGEADAARCVLVDRVKGCSVPTYPTLSFGLLTTRETNSIVDEFEPDVVHLAAPVTLGHAVARVAAKRDIPTVALFQTDLAGFVASRGSKAAAGPIWSWLRRVHSMAAVTLAPTGVMAAELRERGFARIGVWGRGVDHERFSPDRRSETFRRSVGCGLDDVLVGYVGRLAPEKQVWRLATVAREAAERRQRVRLVVVGDGPSRGDLERRLPGAVFTGMLTGEELAAAMASLDVFAHTGAHETFGQTIQEAMASRVAVVAPNAGGPADLIDNGRNGLLYDPNSAAQFNDAVAWMVNSPELRRGLAGAGFADVATRTWPSLVDELVEWYSRAIGLSGRSVMPVEPRVAA